MDDVAPPPTTDDARPNTDGGAEALASPIAQPMSRRTMLKTTAGAAGGLTLAACTSAGSDGALNGSEPAAEAASGDAAVAGSGNGGGSGAGNGGGGTATGTTTAPFDPSTAIETWDEPWTWSPSEFADDALQLNVIEHQSPEAIVGFGNPGAQLFGYNGSIPGPTIRMRGDQTYDLRLLNHLGLNAGSSPVGPAPDPAAFPPKDMLTNADQLNAYEQIPDWCLGEHTNGVHTIHTTNMHTHGLHVRPGFNPTDPETGEATVSDDIFTRLEPSADLRMREANPEVCGDGSLFDEVGPSASYQFILGDVQGDPDQPHPPGTHWYHPHAHGSTHNQVTSGLAGFLVIEGNVDAAINTTLTGQEQPPHATPTGDYDYRERMMFIQRVNPGNVSHDKDAIAKRQQNPTIPTTNGSATPATMTMRPGAIERWRILNGSVDGQGYLRFMVLEGEWTHAKPTTVPANPTTVDEFAAAAKQLVRIEADGTRTVPTTEEIEAAKVPLWQLAVDGVTLVTGEGSDARYQMRNLDFDAPPNPLLQNFTNLGDCFANAESLRTCYNRPNEVYMAPANRTDVMFQAPRTSQPTTYTVLAKATAIHTDNLQRSIQLLEHNLAAAQRIADRSDLTLAQVVDGMNLGLGFPPDTVIGYIAVSGDAAKAFQLSKINDALKTMAPAPMYLIPPSDDDVRLTAAERSQRGVSGSDSFRTRRVTYSGWGAATWPRLVPSDMSALDPSTPVGDINPVYIAKTKNGDELLMPPIYRTMAIDGRKFNPTDPDTPRMGLDTAEEWSAYNNSVALWGPWGDDDEGVSCSVATGDDGKEVVTCGGLGARNYGISHTVGYPVTRNEAEQRGWAITTRAIDHPFHIHTNPMWVLRIDVPDADGNLVNILPAPRWHDVVWLPRSGGRIVFRSRFPDFTGKLVNHCHILLHEDNGMMQMVEIMDDAAEANYSVSTTVASFDEPGPDATDSLEDAYRECTRFIDNNQNPGRAQEYPAPNGVFEPPPLPAS